MISEKNKQFLQFSEIIKFIFIIFIHGDCQDRRPLISCLINMEVKQSA